MTALVCPSCDGPNEVGDQFCGRCGAPLPAGPVREAPEAQARRLRAKAGLLAESAPASDAAVVTPAAPATQAAQEAPAGTGGAGLVAIATSAAAPAIRCPACGHENAAGRTFCKQCGSGLPRLAAPTGTASIPPPAPIPAPAANPAPGAAPLAALTADSAALILASAAPAASAGRAASAAPAATSTPGGGAPSPARRRGGSGWMVVILVLGLLAGVLVTLLPRLMAGGASNEALPNTPNPSEVLPAAAAPTGVLTLEVTA